MRGGRRGGDIWGWERVRSVGIGKTVIYEGCVCVCDGGGCDGGV